MFNLVEVFKYFIRENEKIKFRGTESRINLISSRRVWLATFGPWRRRGDANQLSGRALHEIVKANDFTSGNS